MSLSVRAGKISVAQRQTVARRGYAGDPGLFGSIWSGIKSVGGAVAGGVTGLLTGGPIGAVAGAVQGSGLIKSSNPTVALPGGVPTLTGDKWMVGGVQSSVPVTATPGIGAAIQRLLPGGATGLEVAMPVSANGNPSGFHLNKTGYFLKDGTWVPPQSKWVRNRRKNPTNPRALSNAMSRLDGAKRFQHRLAGYSTPKYTSSGQRKACRK